MNAHKKFLIILVAIFVVTNLVFLTAKSLLFQWGIDSFVLFVANTILFFISILVSMLQRRAITNSNPNVFIRTIMMSMMIKMFTCAIAVLIYAVASGDKFNGKAVFVFMALYIIYQIAEVNAMLKLNKQTNA